MRKVNMVAAMTVFLSTVQFAWAGADAHPDETAGPATRPTVADLLQERVVSAAKGLETSEKLWKSGTISFDQVQLWSERLAQARLDAASSDAERTAVLKELVQLARHEEDDVQERMRAGVATSLDADAARYIRLDAELKLSRQLAPADARANDDKQLLQGTWKVVKKMKNGEAEDLKAAPTTLKFSGGTVTLSEDGAQQSEGTFEIDESKAPRRITLTGTSGQSAGRTFEAIYELDGDTFKLAYGIRANAATPPKDFAGGQGQAAEVLQRQKP